MLKAIRLSGFRGALSLLEISLAKGTSAVSTVVYGRNGSGKSSITDAWEWIQTGKIHHLSKEGAGPDSYPHLKADAGKSFVEIEFADTALGTVRVSTDVKPTKPNKSVLEKLHALAPHPCQLRFEDLSRFVYYSKTERHDALAALMGFVPQVEMGKALNRVLRQLDQSVDTQTAGVRSLIGALVQQVGGDATDETLSDAAVLRRLNAIFTEHNVAIATRREDVQASFASLTSKVTHDERARELADAQALERCLQRLQAADGVDTKLAEYLVAVSTLRARESSAVDSLLLGLYQQGEAVLVKSARGSGGDSCCPLCGQTYEGDLLRHIQNELHALRELKALRDDAERLRRLVLTPLPARDSLQSALEQGLAGVGTARPGWERPTLTGSCRGLDALYERLRAKLSAPTEALEQADVDFLTAEMQQLTELAPGLASARNGLLENVLDRIAVLQTDTARAQLVSDHTRAAGLVVSWTKWITERSKRKGMLLAQQRYRALVDDYVAASIANVEHRFALVSADMERYFGILEENTPGLTRPALRLLVDQDRAVVLEIEFQGEVIAPAYKYLSESQLNSFGLAVFLASARRFNANFPFLVLDDVVNSFDGHKRPQVIKLLKQEFNDFQLLLLTHDNVWWGQLTEQFDAWNRVHIKRYAPASGPVLSQGRSDREQIAHFIDEDDALSAARALGPFLERKLQDLAEAFVAFLPYNQRNEYTLATLAERLAVRLKDKLGESHPVTRAGNALEADLGFRNLASHWKSPDIQLTPEEVRQTVSRWDVLHGLVLCPNPKCYGGPKYDGKAAFVCTCGQLRLAKEAKPA